MIRTLRYFDRWLKKLRGLFMAQPTKIESVSPHVSKCETLHKGIRVWNSFFFHPLVNIFRALRSIAASACRNDVVGSGSASLRDGNDVVVGRRFARTVSTEAPKEIVQNLFTFRRNRIDITTPRAGLLSATISKVGISFVEISVIFPQVFWAARTPNRVARVPHLAVGAPGQPKSSFRFVFAQADGPLPQVVALPTLRLKSVVSRSFVRKLVVSFPKLTFGAFFETACGERLVKVDRYSGLLRGDLYRTFSGLSHIHNFNISGGFHGLEN